MAYYPYEFRATDALRRVVDTDSCNAEDHLLAWDGLRSGLNRLHPIESVRTTESVERVFRGSRHAEDLVLVDQFLTKTIGPAPYAGSRLDYLQQTRCYDSVSSGGVSGGFGGISGGFTGIS